MTTHLLDANVMIALVVAEHEHHRRASAWMSKAGRFAISPVVEGALVRYLVRVGESSSAATEVLRAVHTLPRCEFWPDAVSYADADLTHVRGHRQVTDAYLLTVVAAQPDARLITLDEGLAQVAPQLVDLVPADE